MSTQVPTRFQDKELADIDELVKAGVAESRSELIRMAVGQFYAEHHRRLVGEAMAEAYRRQPQTDEDEAWAYANALALTAEEDWSEKLR